jgi:hypothetical protein
MGRSGKLSGVASASKSRCCVCVGACVCVCVCVCVGGWVYKLYFFCFHLRTTGVRADETPTRNQAKLN